MSHARSPSQIIRSLSLRSRLFLLFYGMGLVLISFVGALIYQQESISRRAVSIALSDAREIRWTDELGERLADSERNAAEGGSPSTQAAEVLNLLSLLSGGGLPAADRARLVSIRRGFESFVQASKSHASLGNDPEIGTQFRRVVEEVGQLERSLRDRAADAAEKLNAERERALASSVVILAGLLMFAVYFAMRVIAITTEPLSELSRLFDEVQVENDLEAQIPSLEWDIPEISRVAQSFSQLLERLRGYRALNVRRLLMEKRRADVIAAAISDGIFLLRGEELMYCNPVGERILGLPAGQSPRGLKLSSATAAAENAAVVALPGLTPVQALRRALSSTIPVEFQISLDDDRKLHFLLQAFPISDEIIEQVEHSMDAPVDRLLDRWQPNTLVLARDVTLVHESQEAKSHFIATLSHEVKTPVTSLTMATRLLKKSVEQFTNPSHRALIETCASDVDRLRGLIEDLLSVSRFDTLTQRLEVKQADLGRLVRQSVQFYQPEAFGRGIEMSCQIIAEGKSLKIDMDPTKISWALSNLLVNALRHTPKGGKIATSVVLADGFVEVRVRDNGPGLDRKRLDRVFDRFSAHYDLRVARTGSVGMGLAIAREIITAHGGKIWVTSEPGRGAEFCFTIPVFGVGNGANPLGLTTTDSNGRTVSEFISKSAPGNQQINIKGEETNGTTTRS